MIVDIRAKKCCPHMWPLSPRRLNICLWWLNRGRKSQFVYVQAQGVRTAKDYCRLTCSALSSHNNPTSRSGKCPFTSFNSWIVQITQTWKIHFPSGCGFVYQTSFLEFPLFSNIVELHFTLCLRCQKNCILKTCAKNMYKDLCGIPKKTCTPPKICKST